MIGKVRALKTISVAAVHRRAWTDDRYARLRKGAVLAAIGMLLTACPGPEGGSLLALYDDDEQLVASIGVEGTSTASYANDQFTIADWMTLDDADEIFIDFFATDHMDRSESQFLRVPGAGDGTLSMQGGQRVGLVELHNEQPMHELLIPTDSFESLRIYNVGACSTQIMWRSLFNQVETALGGALASVAASDDDLDDLIDEIRQGPGVITMSPLMRLPDAPDGVRFNIPLTVIGNPFGRVGFELIVEVDLEVVERTVNGTTNGVLAARTSLVDADDISSQIWADIGLAFQGTDARELIDLQLGIAQFFIDQQLAGILQASNPLNIPVQRVHIRPESVEIVLAESTDDPNFAIFQRAGLCGRPSEREIRVGYKGALFQFVRSRPDPAWFVE